MPLPSEPYSERVWCETLLTLHHIECGSHDMNIAIESGAHDMTLPIHRQWVDAALAPESEGTLLQI
jgi:hypothetical protein